MTPMSNWNMSSRNRQDHSFKSANVLANDTGPLADGTHALLLARILIKDTVFCKMKDTYFSNCQHPNWESEVQHNEENQSSDTRHMLQKFQCHWSRPWPNANWSVKAAECMHSGYAPLLPFKKVPQKTVGMVFCFQSVLKWPPLSGSLGTVSWLYHLDALCISF